MAEVLMDIQHLEKQYMKQRVVKDVSFQIEKGKIYGLIGPNGAGKTTIMKMLGGLVLPTNGTISMYGESTEQGLAKARRHMSFMIENPYVKEKMSARENLEKQRLQKGISDRNRINEVLEQVCLSDTGKKPVKNFSLGMRQRLGIANALLHKPDVMVLDEPINGLDPEGIVEIRELLLKLNQENGMTLIISSHILSELSMLCTDYLFVNQGELIQEISAPMLKKMCQEYYRIHTNDDEKALAILKQSYGNLEYMIADDGSILLYQHMHHLLEVSKCLYEGGVIPITLSIKETNLEEYYMGMVGEKNAQHNEGTKLSNKK